MNRFNHYFSIYFLLIGLATVILSCNRGDQQSELIEKNESDNTSKVNPKVNEFAIIIHGGAGTIRKKNMTPELEQEYRVILEKAVRGGFNILKYDGSSLEAVEKTINILEDSPLFNAGKGSVFTNAGTNEMDASIMNGGDLNA